MSVQRVVVKVGSSSLTDAQGHISPEKMANLVADIKHLKSRQQTEVVLVSSGAIACGLGKLGWRRACCTLPEKQAASAVGQQLLMSAYERLFAEHDIVVAQILLTRTDIRDDHAAQHIRNTIHTLLQHGIVPIVNENDTVAVDEIRFGDNDTLASLVATVVRANTVILLTDIDGLYTANPRKNKDAKRIDNVWEITEALEQAAETADSLVGTGGMQTKVMAAKLAVQSGIDVVIASSEQRHVVSRIVSGEAVGTFFHAQTGWLANAPECPFETSQEVKR